jgi:hypothetical protein
MEVMRFLYRQANWCYQLAWQCFDLTVAHELNAMAMSSEQGHGSCAETPGAPRSMRKRH